jgi:hypothetical protein
VDDEYKLAWAHIECWINQRVRSFPDRARTHFVAAASGVYPGRERRIAANIAIAGTTSEMNPKPKTN